jgi:hypothetical protein
MDEISVLDYVKAKLAFWRHSELALPQGGNGSDEGMPGQAGAQPNDPAYAVQVGTAPASIESPSRAAVLPVVAEQAKSTPTTSSLPWLAWASLLLAIIAQRSLEPSIRSTGLALALYLASTVMIIASIWTEGLSLPSRSHPLPRRDPLSLNEAALWVGIPLTAVAFLTLGGNLFTRTNLLLWIAATAAILWAFWIPASTQTSWFFRAVTALRRDAWRLVISRESLLVAAVLAVSIFFRVYRMNEVPPEMFSDHAEKLLDVWDVLQGRTYIFFQRNTGREGLQMYLTAAMASIFGAGISFTSLKLGTILAGILTLPYIYLLGKEVASARTGILAMLLAGIAYWPNVISRVALRFALYPLFVAPVLYYLIRGLRSGNRNDFQLAGLFLGLGLHGYTPFRIIPVVVLIAVALYLLHAQSQGLRRQTLAALVMLASVAMVVFLPLLRVISNPDYRALFFFRGVSRLEGVAEPLQVFLQNMGRALLMFNWDDGEIWVHSVTHRPALDVVTAALFVLGCLLLIVRYIRRRHWLDLFLLLSIPLLMLPSILSLAFPGENPALNRTAGAIIPVFLIAGLSLDSLLRLWETRWNSLAGKVFSWSLAAFLLILALFQNYDLVFNQYYTQFRLSSWNTSELGAVMRGFAASIGEGENAWVIPYPHWVDTRLVGMHAGYPTRDTALQPDQIDTTEEIPGPKLFMLHPEDRGSYTALRGLYPQGILKEYASQVAGKDFLIYFVP